MPVKSNYQAVRKAVLDLADTFKLTNRMQSGKSIGAEILERVAMVVSMRTLYGQMDPDDHPLAPLKPSTLRRKRYGGYPLLIGVQEGEMLDITNIRGHQEVTDTTAKMTYGGGGGLTEDKAEWFSDGKPNQAPRPFYELGAAGEQEVENVMNEAIDEAHQKWEQP